MRERAGNWYLTPREELELRRPAPRAARVSGWTWQTLAALIVLVLGVCAWSWLCTRVVPHVFVANLTQVSPLDGPFRGVHLPVALNLEVRLLAVVGLWASGLMVVVDLAATMHRVLRSALRPALQRTWRFGLALGAAACALLVWVITPVSAVTVWTCAGWCAAELVLSVTVLWPVVKPWRR